MPDVNILLSFTFNDLLKYESVKKYNIFNNCFMIVIALGPQHIVNLLTLWCVFFEAHNPLLFKVKVKFKASDVKLKLAAK